MNLSAVFDDGDGLTVIDDVSNVKNILNRIEEISSKYFKDKRLKIMLTFSDNNKHYKIIMSRNTDEKSSV